MLGQRELRPVLLASGAGESVTHAYAALKLLSQRLGLMSFDLVLPTQRARGPSTKQIADRVSECADRFLGAAMHDSATIDPDLPFGEASGPDLMRLAAAQLSVTAPTAPIAAPTWTPARSTTAASTSHLTA
jgi:flagellar biosynthesis protein FlhG